jgi:ankyrin repeat protein
MACIAAALVTAPPAAAERERTDQACLAIEQRLEINQANINARILSFLLFDAAEAGCVDTARRLLELGASVEARDRFGNTPLLRAADAGEDEAVETLLAAGSAVNHANLEGRTALLRAVMADRRRTVKQLLAAGADPNLVDRTGVSPIAAAAFNGNGRIVDLLLAAGADPGRTDGTGKGALVYAAGRGFGRVVERLLDAGLEVNARYGHDLTALMWAAGHSNDVPTAEALATVDLLLSRGAAIDLADDRGRTALMIAAQRGHGEIAARLLAAGANPGARDREGKTAQDLASDEATREAIKTVQPQ